MNQAVEAFCSQRDITAWRDRDFDVYLNTSIQREGCGVRLTIENDYISLLAADAEAVAEALYNAARVTVGNRAVDLVTPGSNPGAMKRTHVKSRPSFFAAEAEFTAVGVSRGLIAATPDGVVKLIVATIDDGGIEIVLEDSCYSFALEDAVWMSNSLMKASGHAPIDVFEEMKKILFSQ